MISGYLSGIAIDVTMPHTDEDLEDLESLLRDLPIENDGMNVAELDGFVAGLLVCALI